MAGVRLADVIVPEIWKDYVTKKTLEKSALLRSGILYTSDYLQELANGAGHTINMPFFKPLGGRSEGAGIGYDGTPLTPAKIEVGKQIATKMFRAKAWDSSDFASMLSGADPLGAIASQVADFWAKEEQTLLLASLKGMFSKLGTSHQIDGSSGVLDGNMLIDGKKLLGDRGDELVAVAMHSATYYKLVKDNLVEKKLGSDGKSEISTYFGLEIIKDDAVPNEGGVYDMYLFAKGSVGYANAKVENPVETDRDTLSGIDVLVSRQGWIMHPNGMSIDLTNPSEEQLKNPDSWTKIGDDKEIRIINIKHKVA